MGLVPVTRLRVPALLAFALLVSGCGRLFLLPAEELVATPEALDIPFREVRIEEGRGPTLHGWYLPARTDRVAGTVLFLHGNAGNVSSHLLSPAWLPDWGFNVLLIDYRGYGASEGEASLSGVAVDSRRALAYLAEREPPDTPLAVFGQSLGASVAPYVVVKSPHRQRVAAVVLDSAFSGFRRIAREKLGSFWLTWPFQTPLSWTVPDNYSARDFITRLHPIPVLIIHGKADEIVPARHARTLFELAKEPKALWLVPGAGHVQALRRAELRERLAGFLWERLDGPGPPPRPEESLIGKKVDSP